MVDDIMAILYVIQQLLHLTSLRRSINFNLAEAYTSNRL